MGNCNCGKNAKPTGFGVSPGQEQQDQNRTVLEQQSRAMNAAQEQAIASGGRQSFTLRDRSGSVQSFGSTLERNAFIAREGGTILS